MNKFVQFRASGVIYKRTKEGQLTKKIQETREGSGVVKSGVDLYGKVYRQCPSLIKCDAITVKTYPI